MQGDTGGGAENLAATPNNLFAGKLPIKAALDELRLRLLDLTGRNRLVNFKHTPGKSLQFVHSSIDGTFRRLTADQTAKVTIGALPEPEKADWVMRNGRLAKPEAKDHAVRVGFNPSFELARTGTSVLTTPSSGSQARTLFYAEDLGKHCRKLEREAKLAIGETGANMLYLVMGFLEFPESPGSDKAYLAPLLCVPVSITKADEGLYTTFFLSYTGEELNENLSLREKLKRDFGFNLPEYDFDNSPSVEAYFDEVADVVAVLPGWRVRRMMTLTLLSFTNMLLVRDLDPENWPKQGHKSALLAHPLVQQVFEGRPDSVHKEYAGEYAIDDHPKGQLPLIYDADSSQHSALIDVLEGKNRVIEGPPGTGKSQTITNLIAAALQAGKKVLFVAEKLAALEVVKSRLTQAGLADFVLELHSNKTNKKRILEDLDKRIRLRASNQGDLSELLERQEQKRNELKAYAELMSSKIGNSFELTLHQVMWRSERHRMRCGPCATAVQNFKFPGAAQTSASRLAAIGDRLRYLSEQHDAIKVYGPEHPLWGFFPSEFKPEDDLPVHRTFQEYANKFSAFSQATSTAAALLGGTSFNMTAKGAELLLSVLSELAPAEKNEVDFEVLPVLFKPSDLQGEQSKSVLLDILARQQSLTKAAEQLRQYLVSTKPASNEIAASATTALQVLKNLGLESYRQDRLELTGGVLQQAAEDAREAFLQLQATANTFRLAFSGSPADIEQIQAYVACISMVSMQWIHLRHEEMRIPGCAKVLIDASASLKRLQAKQTSLDELLYMDLLPSQAELKEAILILREGDAWYQLFVGRWRKALGLHRRIARSKIKKPAAERLADLEMLLKHLDAQSAWHADSALREASGTHFNGEQTPLDELAACAQWIENSVLVLEAAKVPSHLFDPVRVERTTLYEQGSQIPIVKNALKVFEQLKTTAKAMLAHAQPKVLKDFDRLSWPDCIQLVERAVSHILQARRLMAEAVRTEASAESGLSALIKSQEVPLQMAELEGHAPARLLLGNRFLGAKTNLEPLLAAHTYGSLIKKATLPGRLEQILLSENCVANYMQLTSLTAAINQGWQHAIDFGQAMAKYGRFEPALWVDPVQKSTSEYAQALTERTRRAIGSLGGLLAWVQYVGVRKEVTELGLNDFVHGLESGTIASNSLVTAFTYRFYASIAQGAFDKSAVLRQFSGRRHASVREEFAELDTKIIALRGRQIAYECRKNCNPPAGHQGARVDDKTEMKLLEYLIPQQKPRVPVRKMLERAGHAIQELKPCFMMGPQAVAQFLVPGQFHFDIVVMDEASQLRPEEAIGAIARGSQLVVVGDPKQLPPTSFFARMTTSDGDDDGMGQLVTSEAESILDVCISHFQPVRTLRWHYRSQHESLIAFSNHHFYKGELVVFPSPYSKSKALGLRYYYVKDGIYENTMNQIEACRVVDAAVEHILCRPHDSLGIVTLNIKQRDLLAEMLEQRLRSIPEAVRFREHWEAQGMELFIKNLENVQGDERDCIMISTTFGKPPGANVVRQNFGPISRDGGWRRLNVLFTRARRSVAVFSSMRPEDIVVDAKTPEGTRALRNYLEYARTGVLPIERETELPPDSDFEIAVMDILRAKGYEVTPQLGVAGFRIDIGVKHPDQRSGYLAAIECDGAAYHSGVSVRDRDRIRQEILESLGWKGRIWRIWSTDWFRNPLAETDRLLQFLDILRNTPVSDEFIVDEADENSAAPGEELVREGNGVTEQATGLVFEDEEVDLEIEAGDLVTFSSAHDAEQVLQVRITSRQTDLANGLVAENTPFGAALMGAVVGDTVVLRVLGKPPQSFVIHNIKRAKQEAGAHLKLFPHVA